MSQGHKFTLDRARQLARGYIAVRPGQDPEFIERVAQRMVAEGECVWHALSVVTGKACWCAACRPDVKRFA